MISSRSPVLPKRGSRWCAVWLASAAWLLPVTAGASAPLRQTACSFTGMIDELRVALKTGSPAYRKYARERLKAAARVMPADELRAAVQHEHDPDTLESLGAALASKSSFTEDATLVQPLLVRAAGDADPQARAAAVRSLRGTGSVDLMAKNSGVVTYEQLIRDSAPEVRQAVVDNLLHESAKVYFGHERTVSEAAVSAALASKDPQVAAKLLSEVSMEAVGHETVERLRQQLRADDPALRGAAATALGGVPGAEAPAMRDALVSLYRGEKDPAVRKAALQGIVRLGMGSARPTLESLRGVAPGLDPEIDAWQSALNLGLQEWHLLLREKERLRR
ncbi:HEAT repeat domain-containing protein [Stigmatella sp. ncwal1]|uniref:HEAT repeat domain-containing protein n=1 Tax=Stigmatella ashevillensis TaxID=2995309 RepID=A0ABT5D362_9BACT|nr:HEAT repeat domain-containing protein [Stigmatella ashevillena]MDC0707563.1 HEAT repeat domain-containing protein [Stigmatella ashevillena]